MELITFSKRLLLVLNDLINAVIYQLSEASSEGQGQQGRAARDMLATI